MGHCVHQVQLRTFKRSRRIVLPSVVAGDLVKDLLTLGLWGVESFTEALGERISRIRLLGLSEQVLLASP